MFHVSENASKCTHIIYLAKANLRFYYELGQRQSGCNELIGEGPDVSDKTLSKAQWSIKSVPVFRTEEGDKL